MGFPNKEKLEQDPDSSVFDLWKKQEDIIGAILRIYVFFNTTGGRNNLFQAHN